MEQKEPKKTIAPKALLVIGVLVVFLLAFVLYRTSSPDEYAVSDDEIALYIKLDVKEDIGLLVFDYNVNGHDYSGGISNANKSLIGHDDEIINVWKKDELRVASDAVSLSIRFQVITEYVDPNFENVYPEGLTKALEPIAWEGHFGESFRVRITGSETDGYQAVLE